MGGEPSHPSLASVKGLAIYAGFFVSCRCEKDSVILRRGDADYSGIGSKHYKASVEAALNTPPGETQFYAVL
jgi:hypothetical protein